MIRRFMIVVLVALGLTLVGLATCQPTTDDNWTNGYRPCATEDSDGPCHWDAGKRGNGTGKSFVVHSDGKVEYR